MSGANVDKAEVVGKVKGTASGTQLFGFTIDVEHTVQGQASGAAPIATTASRTWTDFELTDPKILYMEGDVTFTVTITGGSGHYQNGGAGRQIQFDGVCLIEFPIGSAPITSIEATNITTSNGEFSWWAAGNTT